MENVISPFLRSYENLLTTVMILGIVHAIAIAAFLTALAVAAHKLVGALDRKWTREAEAIYTKSEADRLNAPFRR